MVSMPYKLLLALGKTRLLLLRKLYGTFLVTNTTAIKSESIYLQLYISRSGAAVNIELGGIKEFVRDGGNVLCSSNRVFECSLKETEVCLIA